MDSPLDAFPSETSDPVPELPTTGWFEDKASECCPHFVPVPASPPRARKRRRRGVARLLHSAGEVATSAGRFTVALLKRPMPASAQRERVSAIATAAATSAGVSLLTMWLWNPGPLPGAESLDAVSELPVQVQQAPERQALSGAPVANGPILAAAPIFPTFPFARSASPVSDAPEPPVLPAKPMALNAPRPAARPVAPALPLARKASLVASAPEPAGLVIITEPEGARVTINGVGWGTTPITIRHLPSGAKRIRVTKSGYQSEERVVGGNGASATATLRIVLREASPAGATQ